MLILEKFLDFDGEKRKLKYEIYLSTNPDKCDK